MTPILAALLAMQPAIEPPPTIPPAQIDDALEIGGEDVAARSVRTRLTVAVKIDGRGPYRFIVDSGADRSVIARSVADALALPAQGAVMLHDVAGAARVATVRVATLQLGGSVIERLTLPALRDADIGAQGLIGIDALAEQRLLLDFDRHTIQVEDSRRPVVSRADEIVVTARRRKGQLILTEVTVRGVRVYAVIDTGSEITIGNLALARQLFRGKAGLVPRPTTLTSVTGQTVTADLAVLPALRIGRLDVQRLTIAFADLAPFRLFGLADRPALLLGNDVLELFRRVALDFGRRRVRFQLRR